MNRYRIFENEDGMFEVHERILVFFWYPMGDDYGLFIKVKLFGDAEDAEKWLRREIENRKERKERKKHPFIREIK